MKEPIIFFNSRYGTLYRSIILPNGKKIVLSETSREYRTSDPDEIEFLSKLSGIGSRKINEAEYRLWITTNISQLPHTEADINSITDIEEFIRTGQEEAIIAALRKKGYTVQLKTNEQTEQLGLSSKTEFSAPSQPKKRPKKAGDGKKKAANGKK